VTPATRARAQEAVRRGDVNAIVVLPAGFEISPAMLVGEAAEAEQVTVGIDPMRQAELAYVRAGLHQAAVAFLRRQLHDPDRRAELMDQWLARMDAEEGLTAFEHAAIQAAVAALEQRLEPAPADSTEPAAQGGGFVEVVPVGVRTRPRSAFEICFPMGIIWGLLGLAAEFAMGLVQERQGGTLVRLRVAPISRAQILAGNGLATFVAGVALIVFLLAVGRLLFGVRLQNPAVLAAAVVSIAICFVGLTLMFSVMGRTESSVGGAAWAFLLVMAILGGGMVPQIFMPAWLETASHVSPIKWAILGLEGGIWRDYALADMALPGGVLLFQGGIFALIGLAVIRRSEA
jgi:ABC-2 type transport system permease protein